MAHILAVVLLALSRGFVATPGDSLVLEVGARVEVLRAADIAALPHDTVRWDYHGTPHVYSGVSLLVLLRHVGVPIDSLRGRDMTKRVVVEAADGYRAVFAMAEVAPGIGARVVLVADREDGQPLPDAVGPFRLVVPGDGGGMRGVRQVVALRVRDEP